MEASLRKVKRFTLRVGGTVLYPENFEIEPIISPLKRKSDYKRNLTDAMYYILHVLAGFQSQKNKQDEYEKTGYYNLNADILKRVCGNEYINALRLLKDAGVIERAKSYSTGSANTDGFSKGCRLSTSFNSSHMVGTQLSAYSNVNKNYLKWKNENNEKDEASKEEIRYVTDWYNPQRLTIEVEKAHNVLEFYRHKLIKKSTNTDNAVKQQIDSIINYRYNNARESIDKIRKGNFKLTRSGEDCRLHSSITSLKKEFRPFLRFDGQPLIGIDIKASQPYLLSILLYKDLYKGAATRQLNIETVYEEAHRKLSTERPIMLNIFSKLIDNKDFINDSVAKFHQVNWNEDFYTHLMELEAAKYNSEKDRIFKKREITKHSIMIILYSKSKGKEYYKSFQRFEEFFPLEAELISFFSRISRKDKKNYLPILMQRLESYLMLNEVCKEISEVYPDAPLIPIHDSILTTPVYVDRIKEVMERKLKSLTGIKPGLTIETTLDKEIYNKLEKIVEDDFKEILNKIKKRSLPKINPCEPLLMQNPVWKKEVLMSSRYSIPTPEFI